MLIAVYSILSSSHQITRDLDSLPAAHRISLRDSLLTAIRTFASGPRVILREICIALADLSLQLTAEEWDDPPSAMIALFGSSPDMAGALLEWLGAVVEEYTSNLKIKVSSDFGAKGKAAAQAEQVISLLSMYCQAPGMRSCCFLLRRFCRVHGMMIDDPLLCRRNYVYAPSSVLLLSRALAPYRPDCSFISRRNADPCMPLHLPCRSNSFRLCRRLPRRPHSRDSGAGGKHGRD